MKLKTLGASVLCIALLLQAGEVNDSDNRDALKKKLADYYPNVVGGERPASS